jgi:hypothetical protein
VRLPRRPEIPRPGSCRTAAAPSRFHQRRRREAGRSRSGEVSAGGREHGLTGSRSNCHARPRHRVPRHLHRRSRSGPRGVGLNPEFGIDDTATAEQLPVLLFEPREALLMRYSDGELPRGESRPPSCTPYIASPGPWPSWNRPNAGPSAKPAKVSNCSTPAVGPEPRASSLWSPPGLAPPSAGTRSSSSTASNSASAPHGTRRYGPTERRNELRHARQAGIVAAGLVQWTGRRHSC